MVSLSARKSPACMAFEVYLRTGLRIPESLFEERIRVLESKFNPYHDPRNGQFTFAQGEGGGVSDGVYRPAEQAPVMLPTAGSEPPRGMGDNRPPPDPSSLDDAFPGLATAPAGTIIAAVDPLLDITGPAGQMTSGMSLVYSQTLIAEIQAIDPSYRYDSFGFPNTLEGQMHEINDLRWDRAAAIYRTSGDAGPLQVETMRYLQDRADAEYDNAVAAAKSGRLPPAPTEPMAIGNYIDQAVKKDFRDIVAIRNLSAPTGDAVRISGREYDSSGDDLTYSVPDARVKDVAFDITLSAKNLGTRHIRRFFGSDFQPSSVVIVRPRQVGSHSSYVIKRPEK